MKFIGILVLFNMANPSESPIMMHKIFENKAQCEQALREIPKPPTNIRIAGFCASEDDLTESESV